jgi:hypothetical protein
MDGMRLFLTALCANVAALLFPIKNDIFGMVLLFAVNFLFGLLADLSNHREWSFRKAFRFFRDAAVFFVVIAAVYLLGYFKNEEAATVQCVSFLTYVAIYFYGTNILRNARMVTHEGGTLFRVLDFLYYMFSLRVLQRSSYLRNYFEWYDNEHKNCI